MTPILVLLAILVLVVVLVRVIAPRALELELPPVPPAIVTTQGDVIPLIEAPRVARNGFYVRIWLHGNAREVKCQSAARARVLEAAALELQPLPAETAAAFTDRAIAITRKTGYVRKR